MNIEASEQDDALTVAQQFGGIAKHLSGASGDMLQRCSIAAAETEVLARGLGKQYVRQLAKELRFVTAPDGSRYSETDALMLATATPPARLAALAAVAREDKP